VNLPGFLTRWSNGEIVVTGHRIGLFSIIDRYQQGLTVDQIHEEFPTLELAAIRSVLAFHADQRAEVDKYVTEYGADLERQETEVEPSVGLRKIQRALADKTANGQSQNAS